MKQESVRLPDAESFNRLVLENQEKIFSLFRRMVSSYDEADDLTQETFIKVYKNISKFRSESTAYTWIYRIAVNTGLNYFCSGKNRFREFGTDQFIIKKSLKKIAVKATDGHHSSDVSGAGIQRYWTNYGFY